MECYVLPFPYILTLISFSPPVCVCVRNCPFAIIVDDGPKKYDRNFLLRFAGDRACQEPPPDLIKISDVFQKGGGHMLLK